MKQWAIWAMVVVGGLVGCSNDDSADPIPEGEAITLGFYSDANCTKQVATLQYDKSSSCYSWSRSTGLGGTNDNSVTRLDCYNDRLCYTQHVQNTTCDSSSPTDKVVKNDECLQEPTGQPLWAKILGGNEDCPPPPDGFECPTSAPGEGTHGKE